MKPDGMLGMHFHRGYRAGCWATREAARQEGSFAPNPMANGGQKGSDTVHTEAQQPGREPRYFHSRLSYRHRPIISFICLASLHSD